MASRLLVDICLHSKNNFMVVKEDEVKEFKKIKDTKIDIHLQSQGCLDDCVEHDVWVGRTDGNVSGCVKYNTVYTPRTTTWW